MIGWTYIFGLVALLVTCLCVFIRGADERCSLPEPEPPNATMQRTMAQLAMDEYDAQIRAGGEPDYPWWAQAILRSKK